MTIVNMVGGSGGMSKEEFLDVSTPKSDSSVIPRIRSSYQFGLVSPETTVDNFYACKTGYESILVKGDYPYIQKYYYHPQTFPRGYISRNSLTNTNPDDSNWFASPTIEFEIPTDAKKGTVTTMIGLTSSSYKYPGYFFAPSKPTKVDIPFTRNNNGVRLDYTELNTISLRTAFHGDYAYGWDTGVSYYPSAIVTEIEYE